MDAYTRQTLVEYRVADLLREAEEARLAKIAADSNHTDHANDPNRADPWHSVVARLRRGWPAPRPRRSGQAAVRP